MLRTSFKALALALGLFAAAPAHAAGGDIAIPDRKFSFDGVFGTYDRASAQRGFQVYKEVCSACHSLRLVSYRNLRELGLTEAQVAAIASQFQIVDGPNDEGQMFERPGRPADRFRKPFANDAAARAANNGALPPDLSVMTKARAGGADYLFALLTGYVDPPPGVTLMDGMHYNKYFPGHQIAMGAPINPDQVEYADGTKATVEQMAHDVSTFLQWAAEPELEQRRALGVKIIIFLTILAGLTYAVKRKIWADVEH
ncbi:MAG: cytochrome c1 [Roseomonas sp.]|nr:cytochrome c1 [Roseomonas sp.]MCA3328742.1 cytochrome c1 [Roseomonas sp.]MCA3333066.1 cytochrome c1 [Roseomonas sp.]MCA3335861.1 cytochrome c1 [Roseomonas sp.]MCA3345745.1 cytochrome c1 [Roseomonas sp.]